MRESHITASIEEVNCSKLMSLFCCQLLIRKAVIGTLDAIKRRCRSKIIVH